MHDHNISFLDSQKKKSNNQDDSDEDDDDDEAGPSTQQAAAVLPQAGYTAPMAQPGIPPVAGAPGMPPGGYQGKHHLVNWEATPIQNTLTKKLRIALGVRLDLS